MARVRYTNALMYSTKNFEHEKLKYDKTKESKHFASSSHFPIEYHFCTFYSAWKKKSFSQYLHISNYSQNCKKKY